MAKEKTEYEIQEEAIKVREILGGKEKPSNQDLASLYNGFSHDDRARVDVKVQDMLSKDLDTLNRMPANSLRERIQHNETRKGYLAERERIQERRVLLGEHMKNKTMQTEDVYDLVKVADKKSWKDNKARIQKIFESCASNQDRSNLGVQLINMAADEKNSGIKNMVAQRMSEVTNIMRVVNEGAAARIGSKIRDKLGEAFGGTLNKLTDARNAREAKKVKDVKFDEPLDRSSFDLDDSSRSSRSDSQSSRSRSSSSFGKK